MHTVQFFIYCHSERSMPCHFERSREILRVSATGLRYDEESFLRVYSTRKKFCQNYGKDPSATLRSAQDDNKVKNPPPCQGEGEGVGVCILSRQPPSVRKRTAVSNGARITPFSGTAIARIMRNAQLGRQNCVLYSFEKSVLVP